MSPDPHAPQRASLQGLFFTGLLTLLPIWLTWVVIKFVFVMLSSISAPWVVPLSENIADSFPDYMGWGKALWVQNTIAMAATVLVILGVGVLARRMVGQRLLVVADVEQRYRQKMAGERLMVNELYLTLLFRPIVSGKRFIDKSADVVPATADGQSTAGTEHTPAAASV